MNFIQDTHATCLATGALPLFDGPAISSASGKTSGTTTTGLRRLSVSVRSFDTLVPENSVADEAERTQGQRLQELGTQAAKIAHDLNNILSPILMALEVFRGELTDPTHLKMLEIAKSSTVRAASLAKEILSFASGREEARTSVDLGEVVEEIASIARRTFPKSIEVAVDVAPDLAPITANGTQMHQTLLNLCVNARDAMPAGGTLSLRATNLQIDGPENHGSRAISPGSYVLLEVCDTGSGIPELVRERIFDPFFTTKAPDKGTGLGLASVRSIVENHSGVLSLHTAVGKGTTFHLLLPVRAGQGLIRR